MFSISVCVCDDYIRSAIMFEAQELMEQLTLEKNAEIALKLAEIENEKKQLHARRQLLNALLETFLSDKCVPYRCMLC